MSDLSHVTEDNAKDRTSLAYFERYFIYYFFSWRTLFRSVYAKLNFFNTKCRSVYAKSYSVHAKSSSVLTIAQFMLNLAHFVPYLARFSANERTKKLAQKKRTQKNMCFPQ